VLELEHGCDLGEQTHGRRKLNSKGHPLHWGSAVVRSDIGWSDSATSVETLVKGCQRDARTH
jgi:hypothetical protein